VGPWPSSAAGLVATQLALASADPPLWRPAARTRIGGCFCCFERGSSGPGRAGDRAWAAAALGKKLATVAGAAGAAYEAGLLALREGPLLEAAVDALADSPDVLLVNATGRDHPRRAGLALHLGNVLDVPTVGVTHRTLVAAGEWPPDKPGVHRPLLIEGELVGYWLRTKRAARPLAVHAGWRTDPDTAAEIVRVATRGARTPEPLRLARRAAREARAGVGSWLSPGVSMLDPSLRLHR
jgi:deoxyribonuclease V